MEKQLGKLLTISGPVTLTNGLTIDGTGNTTVSGLMSSTGALTMAGADKLTLSNTSNSFSGQLTVQAGTLSIDTINNISTAGELGNSALAVFGAAAEPPVPEYNRARPLIAHEDLYHGRKRHGRLSSGRLRHDTNAERNHWRLWRPN